jgi:multiple sugar transport system permease protein
MMTGYFNTLPKELDEAARMDGAGPLTVLWRILVPISIPGIVSVGLFARRPADVVIIGGEPPRVL